MAAGPLGRAEKVFNHGRRSRVCVADVEGSFHVVSLGGEPLIVGLWFYHDAVCPLTLPIRRGTMINHGIPSPMGSKGGCSFSLYF